MTVCPVSKYENIKRTRLEKIHTENDTLFMWFFDDTWKRERENFGSRGFRGGQTRARIYFKEDRLTRHGRLRLMKLEAVQACLSKLVYRLTDIYYVKDKGILLTYKSNTSDFLKFGFNKRTVFSIGRRVFTGKTIAGRSLIDHLTNRRSRSIRK